MVNPQGILVECVERLNDHGDDHNEGDDDENVEKSEEFREDRMPAAVRVRSSNDSLREDEINDKEEDHPCCHEDLGRYGDWHLCRSGGPYDSHHAGGDSGHAKTEHHSGHDEFMSPSLIHLENGHMGDGAENEENEKDGSDWDIEIDGWCEAQRSVGRRVWSMLLRHRRLEREVSIKNLVEGVGSQPIDSPAFRSVGRSCSYQV